ncbi:MAG: EAL domain-containing protein [Butyrivibrio sp.]|nr:EAL domain-containing protein [Butyrivibrio sp.]
MNDSIRRQKLFHRTVLVVDDEAVNRQMLGAILGTAYEVLYAANGREALEQVRIQKDLISLILLDLLMPEMDGYQVLEELRADPILRRIPVIVLTADRSAEVKSLQLGAADFLSKPYDMPEVIQARVRHSIELSEDTRIIQATENDSLTGLYTREFFFEYAHKFDRFHQEKAIDAIVLNFNRFHMVNELHGREFGDRVLCAIADGIRGILEETDGVACRYDADTFFIYVSHRSDYDHLINSVLRRLGEVMNTPEMRIRMGVYQDVYRAARLEERFDRALQACNSIRNQFGFSYAIYDMNMHEREVYSARLMEDFPTALETAQFQVRYQPKFNIRGETPRLCSAEALISWQHPEYGRVRPDAFIPLFEENGLIRRLDHFVWRETARQLGEWKKQYGAVIPVSVNVSRVDIYDPDIVSFLLSLVEENHIETEDLLLEITESAYTDNSRQIVQVVSQLRDKGFKVEMDDFGSGYSSLNMLTTLPIDALKLDMAFIRDIARDNKEMRMVELVLEIAAFLEVPVIAEGVETKEQYELLHQAGCDIIQGYYFSRPIDAEEYARFIMKEMALRTKEG